MSHGLDQSIRQWDVEAAFQTDPQNGMTSEGYLLATSLLLFRTRLSDTTGNCRCLVAKRWLS